MRRLYVAALAAALVGATALTAGLQPDPAPTPPGRTQHVRTLTPEQAAAAELHRRLDLWRACHTAPADGWPCNQPTSGGAR